MGATGTGKSTVSDHSQTSYDAQRVLKMIFIVRQPLKWGQLRRRKWIDVLYTGCTGHKPFRLSWTSRDPD